MNQWAFVIAAYALVIAATAVALAWAYASCSRAEGRADGIGRDR